MAKYALFSGLIVDEEDNHVDTVIVGDEACYVVDIDGFKRHIPSENVDRQVLQSMLDMIEGHEDLISEQTAKMLGQEDIFTKAVIEQQLKSLDNQYEKLFDTGIPEESRTYMGMTGYKIVINHHGEIIKIEHPTAIDPEV